MILRPDENSIAQKKNGDHPQSNKYCITVDAKSAIASGGSLPVRRHNGALAQNRIKPMKPITALSNEPPGITNQDMAALKESVRMLEKSGFLSSLTHLLGRQISTLGQYAPAKMRNVASQIATRALEAAMTAALSSLPSGRRPSSFLLHKAAVTATGAIGGAFGMAALPLELPASTVLMLRSIADIARAEGEDLDAPETALACLAVFALGGRTPEDDQLDSAYLTARLALAETISEASHYIGRGAVDMAAPPIIKLMSMIAKRYGLALSQKMAAQAVPVVGALGGAMVNLWFVHHLERIAQGHFTVRRLERAYGAQPVRAAYERLKRDLLPS
jgi:hypothetical protein